MSPWAAHPELYDHLAFRLFFGSPLTSLYTYPGSTVGRILVTIAFPDSLDPHPRTFEYFHRHWAWAGTWSETTYTYNQSVEVLGDTNEHGVPDWMGDERALKRVYVRFEDLDTGKWGENTCVDKAVRRRQTFRGEHYWFWQISCGVTEVHDP